ncbi:MAG: nitric oxide reductase activation protein [Blautia sp.]|nr:nitric oxide reductase activation protein [Blautia sp.]
MSPINNEEALIDEYQLELENRIRNLLWTVSGDYRLDMKPDLSLFLRSEAIALYDGVKQGALACFFDRDELGMYLVKKVYLGADEQALTMLASLCVETAIGDRLLLRRPGLRTMQKKAIEDILDQEFEIMPDASDRMGQLRLMVLRDRLEELEGRKTTKPSSEEPASKDHTAPREEKKRFTLQDFKNIVYESRQADSARELAAVIDRLYNGMVDPDFVRRHGSLERVLSVTLEELASSDWQDYLSEELYEDALESYLQQMAAGMTKLENEEVTQDMEQERQKKRKVRVLTPEMLQKAHTYVELNFGRSYLSETEEKKMNYLMCRDVHADCSLYFTEGILKNPVKRNYQYEYAIRLKKKNLWTYHDKHRIAKQNIASLTQTLKKSLTMRSEILEVLSDRGRIIPARLWRIGRSREARVFSRQIQAETTEFVVDVLIDASGSQMSRQGEVALQAYIISRALSNVDIPHRVMSYCTFWDYTVMHRFREYDDSPQEDENIFNYVTSSNNRDGLAIRTVGLGLLARQEEKKILIILSDGKPYDVIIGRPNAKNPAPYHGDYAVSDTAMAVRRLRREGVSVLGVFAGEDKDLAAERKIFGKDFAFIRSMENFSRIVGRYLMKLLEREE